jgi:hypothetical protein
MPNKNPTLGLIEIVVLNRVHFGRPGYSKRVDRLCFA